MGETAVCIAHGKDADGLTSASLVKMATDARIILADYGDLLEQLRSVQDGEFLYICDLGTNGSIAESFINELKRILSFASVHYIDHHPLDPTLKENLQTLGVNLTHSLDESTSVLTYKKLQDRLRRGASILAAYGAITDYMDGGPIARKIIGRYDRQFVLLESTLLTYALIGSADELNLRSRIVSNLSDLKFPHQIAGLFDAADKGLETTARLMLDVSEKGLKQGQIAHMEVMDGSPGTVANLLVGAFDVPVGIAYKHIKKEKVYEISLRGSYDSEYDLGKVVSHVTAMIGGSGGGHMKASGARIPHNLIQDFLDLTEFEIDKVSAPHHRGVTRKT
jgi:single-stranded DNA-specific DHH superfamily exonuclease